MRKKNSNKDRQHVPRSEYIRRDKERRKRVLGAQNQRRSSVDGDIEGYEDPSDGDSSEFSPAP